MSQSKLEALLHLCSGITITNEATSGSWRSYKRTVCRLNKDQFSVPENVLIRITGTATKGTIGRLVDMEFEEYRWGDYDDEIYSSSNAIRFIIQVDGRDGTNRIIGDHAEILFSHEHNGLTRYERNVKKKQKIEIPEHVNKYNQKVRMGDWVVGLGFKKTIYFGQVVGWTKASILVNHTPSVKGSKHEAIRIPKETLVLPGGIDYESAVTMMALGGWQGNQSH